MSTHRDPRINPEVGDKLRVSIKGPVWEVTSVSSSKRIIGLTVHEPQRSYVHIDDWLKLTSDAEVLG